MHSQKVTDITFTFEESINKVCTWKRWVTFEDGYAMEHHDVLWEILE